MTIPAVETGFRKIPLESLVPSPFNVRSIRTEARIAEVAQSLAADGQWEAITVYPGTDTEKYLIVSGVTRYLAAQSLGWETLAAQVDASLDPGNALALVRASRTHKTIRCGKRIWITLSWRGNCWRRDMRWEKSPGRWAMLPGGM